MKRLLGRLKNQSVLYQWILAYSLILLILLASGIFLNRLSVGAIREETVNSQQYFLMAVNNDIKAALDQAQQMYNSIYFNRYFLSLGKLKDMTADTQYTIYSFNNSLKENAMNTAGLKYLIYYPDLDTVISEHGSLDSETYYNFYIKDKEMSHEGYRSLLNSRSEARYFLMRDGNYQTLCYTRSSAGNDGTARANIIILLPGEQLREMLDQYFDYNINAIALKDKQNHTILFQNLADSVVVEKFLQEDHTDGLYEIESHGDLIVAYARPLMPGWTCYLFSYASDFWYQSMAINRLSAIVIFLGMFICGLGAWIALKKCYDPVRGLLKQARQFLPEDQNVRNEYQALGHALEYMDDESKKKNLEIQEAHGKLREELALRLLHGQLDDEEALERFNDFFQDENFVLAAIRFEDCAQTEREHLHQSFLKEMSAAAPGEAILGVRDGKYTVLMLNLPETGSSQEQIDHFISALSGASEKIHAEFGVECLFAVNPEPAAFDALSPAYKQLVRAMEYKKIMKTEEIFTNKLVSSFTAHAYYFPLNIEYELSRQIRQGDFEGAKKQLDVLFRINFYEEPVHLYMTRCLLYDIIGTLVKAVDPRNNPEEIRLLENINIDLESNDEESLRRVQTEIEEVMRVICTRLGQDEQKAPAISSTKLETLEHVKNYLSEHLSDLSLTQDAVASAFGISLSQLTKIFRESQGSSVVEYINHLRIDRAKEMLKETEKSIDEIAVDCGYSGSKTLTRLFKKYEGITPGVWRRIHPDEDK